ncbi:PGF-CTERM sorting domain-containing protein [Halobacterium hubeiense]|uniref:PGF-CTERM sorting domain-containing protein n=1 Tax=Halobacterium hubeiense TaxID=1407499 RepID=UPI003C771559
MTREYLRAGILVAVVLAAATFAGVTTAATGGSIDASPDSPGETAEHTATVTVDGDAAGSSWNGLKVSYDASDASNVDQRDVATIGIDEGDDSQGDTIDVNASDDLDSVSESNNGNTLKFTLGGSYSPQEGDELVVVYEDVQNPDAGEYEVNLDVNPQSSGGETFATLAIESETTTTQEPTTTESPTTEEPTTTTTQTPTATTTQDDGDDASFGSDSGVSLVQGGQPYVGASPDTANETATHVAAAVVDAEMGDSSWTGLEVNYSGTGADVSNVGQNDVVTVGIDRGDDGANTTIDRSYASSLGEVSGSNDGATLTFGFDGDYELQEGDQVVVVYEDVQNPDAGDYSVGIDVNPQTSGGAVTASLDVTEETTTATETAEPTATATAEPTPTQTDAPTTTANSTPAESPGFGTVAAVVALAAAALLARR